MGLTCLVVVASINGGGVSSANQIGLGIGVVSNDLSGGDGELFVRAKGLAPSRQSSFKYAHRKR